MQDLFFRGSYTQKTNLTTSLIGELKVTLMKSGELSLSNNNK